MVERIANDILPEKITSATFAEKRLFSVIETILGFPTMQPRLHGFAALRAIGRLDIRKVKHSVSPFLERRSVFGGP